MTIYADDVQLLFTSHRNKLGELRKQAENYPRKHEQLVHREWFKINPQKTQCIIFGSPQNNKKNSTISVEIKENCIKAKPKVKSLGVWLDRNLTFKYHINTCVRC